MFSKVKRMLQYCFKMYFIFMLLQIIIVNYDIFGKKKHPQLAKQQKCETLLVKCSCRFPIRHPLYGYIECKNMSDFSNFSGILSEISKVAYTIRFEDMRYLPEKTLQGLKINMLVLDGLDLTVCKNVFGGISSLDYFRVLRSSIESFSRDEFMGLRNLRDLHLQHNQIKVLGHLQLQKKLSSLNLAGNPLQCDCRQQPVMLQINASNTLSTDIELCLRSEFVNTLRCPEVFSCSCTYIGEFSFMSVECSSKNLSILSEVFKNNSIIMEDNSTVISDYQRPFVIDQNIYPLLHLEDHVLQINLENNSLESLEGIKLHPDLLQLYLANNKLRRLPEFIFDNLQNFKQVSLSGIPWECDCNTIKFKKWITPNYLIIQDMNDTRGKSEKGESNLDEKIISTLSDLDICPTNDKLILSASVGFLAFLTLCLSAKFLYSKYQLNVKVFLYFHGFTFVKEEDLDHDKKFDAFLSFSHIDGAFVANEIVPELENKAPNVRLCIHHRDFLAGEFIYNNIKYAVENSKKTIIFLSRSFLESEWCLIEFQAAHEQTLKDKFQRIILIKVGDLPKEIDHRIKMYLDSTTYLTWGENYFWKKLLFILPTSSSEENSVSRNKSVTKIARDISFPDLSKYIVKSSHKSHQSHTIV